MNFTQFYNAVIKTMNLLFIKPSKRLVALCFLQGKSIDQTIAYLEEN